MNRKVIRKMMTVAVVALGGGTACGYVPGRSLVALPAVHAIDTDSYLPTSSPAELYVIAFGAAYCKPCWEEWPILQKWHTAHRDSGLDISLVLIDENTAGVKRVRDFAVRTEIEFPIVWDRNQKWTKIFHIDAVPTIVVLDENRQVVDRLRGFEEGGLERIQARLTKLR